MKRGEKVLCRCCSRPYNTVEEADNCLEMDLKEQNAELERKQRNLKSLGIRPKLSSDNDIKTTKKA
jgi:hypothetical protein